MQSKATPVTNISIIKNALNSVFYCYVLIGQLFSRTAVRKHCFNY